jgi:hypothetical protein
MRLRGERVSPGCIVLKEEKSCSPAQGQGQGWGQG